MPNVKWCYVSSNGSFSRFVYSNSNPLSIKSINLVSRVRDTHTFYRFALTYAQYINNFRFVVVVVCPCSLYVQVQETTISSETKSVHHSLQFKIFRLALVSFGFLFVFSSYAFVYICCCFVSFILV